MMAETLRYLAQEPVSWLRRPLARLQPILAKAGKPNVDLARLAERLNGIAEVLPVIAVQSPEHWAATVRGLGPDIDAILPVSIPAYPTEVWNSHPRPLVERGLPFVFWPLLDYDEPDFWRWSARDMLRALGVDVHIVKHHAAGLALLKALAMRRFLRDSRLVVFGEQNFPWNATAAGHLITASLGTRILVKSLDDFRQLYPTFNDAQVDQVWATRQGSRYRVDTVLPADLRQAVRSYLAIRTVLEDNRALGFGVNCFGDLITHGGRDVPCLAQALLREDGYIASCDGDFCAMMSMVLTTWFLDQTAMMSNMYPVSYVGALQDHFGEPLSPNLERFPKARWPNLARLAHCGYVGVVSPEMTPSGCVRLSDWGGTYEMKRDGRGCGLDGDLRPGEPITVVELCFDGKTLLLAQAKVAESTRHRGMPHCEASALLEFRDLEGFVENISREHTAVVYGDHIDGLRVLAGVLGLQAKVF
jgi:L-fucose isomerase-like protein